MSVSNDDFGWCALQLVMIFSLVFSSMFVMITMTTVDYANTIVDQIYVNQRISQETMERPLFPDINPLQKGKNDPSCWRRFSKPLRVRTLRE